MEVICIDNKNSNLTLFKKYKVIKEEQGTFVIENDLEQIAHSFKDRFLTVQDARDILIKELT